MADTLRIIGGEWRGRRIRFPGKGGIRPTPDRVRETLFNWLMAQVPGSRCLDLFACSGALGLEALSRGAAHATFVERDRENAARLRETTTTLAPGRATVVEADALAWLAGPASAYEIVFLDPPFAADILADAMRRLDAGGFLAPGARVYLEMPAAAGPPELPPGWRLHRTDASDSLEDISAIAASDNAMPDLVDKVTGRVDASDVAAPAAIIGMDRREFSARRKAAGVTMAQAGATLGVTERTVWRWEHGTSRIDPWKAEAIRRMLTPGLWAKIQHQDELSGNHGD